jgi:orotate phosphoribosyltransferase
VLGAICLVDRKLGASENLAAIRCAFASIFEVGELIEG